jgi:siroheme synthase-like protein
MSRRRGLLTASTAEHHHDKGEADVIATGDHALSATHAPAQVSEYYPVALDLRDRPCLVVGGGPVAEAKVEGLLSAGARVTVVSPTMTERLASWAAADRLVHRAREYCAEDLEGQQLVFAATDRRAVTETVAAEARRRGVWVNAADDPIYCDFLLPSVLRRGRLVVAVSTGGASPALAARVRRDLERHLAPEYAELVELAAEVRAELRAASRRPSGPAWRNALDGELIALLAEGRREDARLRLLERLAVAGCR